MAKCLSCGERKGSRFCPALNSTICSLCCGTKREREISCVKECDYLWKGTDYQLSREIQKRISSDLHSETEDVFQRDDVTEFVMTMELFFVDQFYRGRGVNDNHIHEALAKIYAYKKEILKDLKPSNRCEELVFQAYDAVNRRVSGVTDDLKARAILRIMKSIRSSSGGVLGTRNYLEMIYSQQSGKGKWADLFTTLETKK